MDFSKTVNLPKTSFPMKGDLPRREPQFLNFWRENNVYNKLKKKNPPEKKFILHDGPPYANGRIHIGHALNKILKDIIVKFMSVKGFNSPYVPGWDCHGLPIEQQLLKELKIDKSQIDALTFRKKAAEFALKFVEIQREEFKRLGIWGDWETPYLTLAPYYEAAIISVFGELVKRNLIYRKKKPVYWCPTCQTALADAEVEYADHISPSIFVKFPIVNFPSVLPSDLSSLSSAVVIWTTTPWTLPANVALAFNPDEEYVFLKVEEETLILAKKRLQVFTEKLKIKNHEVISVKKGSNFEGIVCRNPLIERESKGVLADFVSMEDGTGVVHIAPGHGVDDYQVGLKYNLPVISPVNESGVFTDEAGEFKGHRVFAANHLIVENLQKSGHLMLEEKITHSYPHCWRCKRAIIFRAAEQWFLDVNSSNLKERLLDEIKKVRWIPEYGQKRISSMVEQRPDWCLSRQRLWGTPIPVFYCKNCGEPLVDSNFIDGIAKLFAVYGSNIWYEKTSAEIIDLIGMTGKICCKKCKETKFDKERDIFDVWFDSGVSSFAVLNKENFADLDFPSDIYLEGSDQHRGWFQTSLIPSVAVKNSAPYRLVLTHGFVVDGEGKKMSKSLGNVVAPEDVIKNYGADVLRLWVAGSDYSEDVRISKEILAGLTEIYRKIRNTMKYILGNISDMPPGERVEYALRQPEDKFITARIHNLAAVLEKEYGEYRFHKIIYHLNNFCVNDLSSFYFDISKDCLYTFAKNSYERRSVQSTLEDIFIMLEKYLSPMLTFTAEDAWQSYRTDRNLNVPESVFLHEFPDFAADLAFDGYDDWLKLWAIRDKVNVEIEKLRQTNAVGSSLECNVSVSPADEAEADLLRKYSDKLAKVFIVSEVVVGEISPKKETEIIVRKSAGRKCARCWNYRDDVSDNPEKFEICRRCYEVIKG